MNQGNPRAGGHAGDNGVWHDGGLLLWFPKADRWVAMFLAFQSQSWHTDDRTGDPIDGRTGAEAARFYTQHRRLAAAEQSHPAIDIIATRVMETLQTSSAVLLLNTTDEETDLTGWSLVTESGQNQSPGAAAAASETVAVRVPKSFFNPGGGIVTLLDASGLKVAGATYPSASDARPGWNKVV
jgi:hypothetical protein